jgi:hypothetical protein
VERVRAELGIDAELRTTLISDQWRPTRPWRWRVIHLRHAVFFPAVFLGTRRPHGHHRTLYDRNSDAALSANCSLLPITVAPESTGRGGFDPHVALRSNSRKKS